MSLFLKLLSSRKPLITLRKTSSYLLRNTTGDQKESLIIKKFTELNEAYVRLIGLDEVKRFQDKVIVIQDKLEKAQVVRRDISKELNDVRKHLNRLQEQLHKVNRYEERQKFIDLTSEETEIIKKERDLSVKFEEFDKMEREIFTALCNAVRDSHEKERAQSEYTKYFSIILSIIGTFVGAVLSMAINTVRTKELISGIERNFDEKLVKTNNDLVGIHLKIDDAHVKLNTLIDTINQTVNTNKTDISTNIASIQVPLGSLTQNSTSVGTNIPIDSITTEPSDSTPSQSDASVPDFQPIVSGRQGQLLMEDDSQSSDQSSVTDDSHLPEQSQDGMHHSDEDHLQEPQVESHTPDSVTDKHMTAAAFTLIGAIFVLRVIFGY